MKLDLVDKNAARAEARSRRADAAKADPKAAGKAARIFQEAIAPSKTDVVAVYRAIQSELDPAPLVSSLWAGGIATCFPVVIAAHTPLEFRLASADTVFVSGGFGTSVPPEGSQIVVPTIIVAPLLAFDARGYRLGYGGGFYDRTLEKLRAEGAVSAFGYAYAGQEADAVPIEPTDQRLDGVVTEHGMRRFGAPV